MAKRKNKFGGWSEYRYGKTRKPVTLPRIYSGAQKDHIVSSVMDTMREWRLSPFENEAACVIGIRSALCLHGFSWAASDFEATAVVAEGLRLLGAKRPTWEQGQPEYSVASENCRSCAGALPDRAPDGARARHFCSADCARFFLSNRQQKHSRIHDAVRASAHVLVYSAKISARECAHCEKVFKPNSETKQQKYCSPSCYRQGSKRALPTIEAVCRVCSTAFRAKTAWAVCCSEACKRTDENRQKRERRQGNVIYLTADRFERRYVRATKISIAVFDRMFG